MKRLCSPDSERLRRRSLASHARSLAELSALSGSDDARRRLLDDVRFANDRMTSRIGVAGSGSQILPVILGSVARAVRVLP